MGRLTKDITNLGNKLRYRQRCGVLPPHIHCADTHQETACILSGLGEEIMPFLFLDLGNDELDVLGTPGRDFHIILVNHLVLNLERLLFLVDSDSSIHFDILDTHLVTDDSWRIRIELDGAIEFFGFLSFWSITTLRTLGIFAGEAFIHLLEVRYLGIELFKGKAAFEGASRLISNGVTWWNFIHNGSTIPSISGIIGRISGNPAQNGNLAKRGFIANRKGLVIGPRRSEILDWPHHRVTPVTVLIGE